MKSIDPKSGLKQIITGKLYLPRKPIVESIRSKKINQNLLGYYLTAIISADWSTGEYRRGLIRHDIKRLAEIWNIPYSTLTDNLNKLLEVELLTKKNDLYLVNDFDDFQTSGGQYSNKIKLSDEDVEHFFGKSFIQSEISDSNSNKSDESLKIPIKNELNRDMSIEVPIVTRTISEYQQICTEYGFINTFPDDLRWIDEHFGADGKYIP